MNTFRLIKLLSKVARHRLDDFPPMDGWVSVSHLCNYLRTRHSIYLSIPQLVQLLRDHDYGKRFIVSDQFNVKARWGHSNNASTLFDHLRWAEVPQFCWFPTRLKALKAFLDGKQDWWPQKAVPILASYNEAATHASRWKKCNPVVVKIVGQDALYKAKGWFLNRFGLNRNRFVEYRLVRATLGRTWGDCRFLGEWSYSLWNPER